MQRAIRPRQNCVKFQNAPLFAHKTGHVSKTAYSLTPEADDEESPAKNA